MRLRAIHGLALLMLGSTELRAQEQKAPVPVGSVVRLEAPAIAPGWIEGTVSASDAGSLTVQPSGRTPLQVPLDAIKSLDVQTGRSRHTRKGAVIGGAVGAVIGAIAGSTLDLESQSGFNCCYLNRKEAVLYNGAFGALTGVALGAGIGVLVQTTDWAPVRRDRIKVSVVPHIGRALGVSVSVEF